MANPNAGEINTTLANGIKPYTDLIADYPTIVTSIDAATAALEGNVQPSATRANHDRLRALLRATNDPALHRQLWNAWGLERMSLAQEPYTDTSSVEFWARLHRILHDASESFNDRAMTIPTSGSAGGSNVGDGTLKVLKEDWEAYPLQHLGDAQTLTFECVTDQNKGATKNAELFDVRAEDVRDILDVRGSGLIARRFPVRHSGRGEGGSFGQNMSFDSAFSGSGTDKIPGWTIAGDETKITPDTSNTYNAAPGASTSQSLAFAADAAATNQITQALSLRRINVLTERTPWMFEVKVKHSTGSITGTVSVKMGSKTNAFNLTGATTSWQTIQFPFDKNLFYRNWREDAPDLEIEVTNLSAGTLYLDAAVFAPLTFVGGLYWWLSGGETAFLERDVFTHASTGGAWADAELMNSARRAGIPISMPTDNTGSETISDP